MKVLKSFEFKSFGTASKHDWDAILDGKTRQLDKGTDYDCEDQTMRMMAYKAGRKLGLAVQVASVEGGLVIQASPATKEQVAEWRKADAESKTKATAKRAEKSAAKKAEKNGQPAAAETPKTEPAKPTAPTPKPVSGKK